MSLHHVEPFAFDRIFAIPPHTPRSRAPGEDDARLELAALKAEVHALRADSDARIAIARAEGFEAGLAQARAERDAALHSAVERLKTGIDAVDARFGEALDRLSGDATETALAAAELLAARTLEAGPTAAIDEAIGRALSQVARGTELEVRVHPDVAEAVEACIAARQANDRRRLHLNVAADASLAPGDAEIGWQGGGLSLDAAARKAAILAELETLLPK